MFLNNVNSNEVFKQFFKKIYTWADFIDLVNKDADFRAKVIRRYRELKSASTLNEYAKVVYEEFNENDINARRDAANYVWRKKAYYDLIAEYESQKDAKDKQRLNQNQTQSGSDIVDIEANRIVDPFDKRLYRIELALKGKDVIASGIIPYSTKYSEAATTGYIISREDLEKGLTDPREKERALELREAEYKKMLKDDFYKGVPALQNNYALVRLFGSEGGKYLINQKKQRRWYEIDTSPDQLYNFASAPTTTSIISWGNADPYGRTPYSFTDFVFCKYWNKIPNNRLITLRRYAAPILDNLKFPGMKGDRDKGETKDETIPFPPMSTAVTYFGGETGNSLTSILKFATGLPWEEIQAGIWEVSPESVPDSQSGPGQLFGSITKLAEMLNVAAGNFSMEYIMNRGQLPPDPYKDGPYENRIMGPVNRIDSVFKRKPGLIFEWDGLSIVFEYVARPVGGINPKAVLLDILSNFLVMGSASAVFFGGAHRFMADPMKYPFIGGKEGIERWYRGDPVGWGLKAIKQFTGEDGGVAQKAASNIFSSLKQFVNQILAGIGGEAGSFFGAGVGLFSGGAGNLINNAIAKKTAGQIPYLRGLRAILTGEPIGEWHLTIGNPLNPIAMIGNLICEKIEVEFNEELGPDDFPTEMKITVRLKHAMARDRDAIESIFNRGMGRIYTLPESFRGTADGQTAVDKYTQENVTTGNAPDRKFNIKWRPGMDTGYIPPNQVLGSTPSNRGSEVSIWDRGAFSVGISENSNTDIAMSEMFRTAYRAADWIAIRSLK